MRRVQSIAAPLESSLEYPVGEKREFESGHIDEGEDKGLEISPKASSTYKNRTLWVSASGVKVRHRDVKVDGPGDDDEVEVMGTWWQAGPGGKKFQLDENHNAKMHPWQYQAEALAELRKHDPSFPFGHITEKFAEAGPPVDLDLLDEASDPFDGMALNPSSDRGYRQQLGDRRRTMLSKALTELRKHDPSSNFGHLTEKFAEAGPLVDLDLMDEASDPPYDVALSLSSDGEDGRQLGDRRRTSFITFGIRGCRLFPPAAFCCGQLSINSPINIFFTADVKVQKIVPQIAMNVKVGLDFGFKSGLLSFIPTIKFRDEFVVEIVFGDSPPRNVCDIVPMIDNWINGEGIGGGEFCIDDANVLCVGIPQIPLNGIISCDDLAL